MSTSITFGRPLSSEVESEHIRMADLLLNTLRELNMAHESVNVFYASDNSYRVDAEGWRALSPYAAVQHALKMALLKLCRGDEEQVEWLTFHLHDNGEDVAYNLDLLRKEWDHREEVARLDHADRLLVAYAEAKRADQEDEARRLWHDLVIVLCPLVGNSARRAGDLVEIAFARRWFFSDFIDEQREQWAENDAQKRG